MKKVLKVAERVFLTIIYIIGTLELAFLIWGAVMLYDSETLHFDRYTISELTIGYDDSQIEEMINNKERENIIEVLSFDGVKYYDQALCHAEIENPILYYSLQVSEKYDRNASLHIEVEQTPKTFTVYMTGWGYPEEGEPECLDRTYIFDIEGAGPDKLPVMLNKDEYFS